MESLTHKRLQELLTYSKRTGRFTWNVQAAHRRKPGELAGGKLSASGRHRIRIDGKLYYAYRLAWFYVTGAWPNHKIDHRDGDPSNDRWPNIRDVTQRVNCENQRKATRKSSTGMLGAHQLKDGSIESSIWINGKKKYLGKFPTADAAHQAYLKEKRRSHPGCTI